METETIQMRLTELDREALAEIQAWYKNQDRNSIIRLAINELRLYVEGARKRKADALILAAHRPAVPGSRQTYTEAPRASSLPRAL